MAYAAYSDSFNALSPSLPPACAPQPVRLMVLDVIVPSCDAFQVRQLMAGCPNTGILRCVPRLRDRTVLLEIQMPAKRVEDVMHVLMTSVPNGEVGALHSWRHHMTTHGMTHGF